LPRLSEEIYQRIRSAAICGILIFHGRSPFRIQLSKNNALLIGKALLVSNMSGWITSFENQVCIADRAKKKSRDP
jgi:hypothetical protein